MSEEVPQKIASVADGVQDWQLEPSRQSQRVRKTVERYASEQFPSRLQRSLMGLSHRQRVCFEELQGALTPETVSLLLDLFMKRNKDEYPVPLANSRISIIPHDIWDGIMAQSTIEIIELFSDYLRLPSAPPEVPDWKPIEAELQTRPPPYLAFAPYSYLGSSVMVIFMSTFNSCRTEVCDPADCLANDEDWDALSCALQKILGGVHGADGEPVLWDCIERPCLLESWLLSTLCLG